jgi:hypothetical protein
MTKSYDLIGAALDWAVAKCEDNEDCRDPFITWTRDGKEMYLKVITFSGLETEWEPSTDWVQGGPIIDREHITIIYVPEDDPNPLPKGDIWTASVEPLDYGCTGKTALIAAMRCFCALKLGEDIEIPKELQ